MPLNARPANLIKMAFQHVIVISNDSKKYSRVPYDKGANTPTLKKLLPVAGRYKVQRAYGTLYSRRAICEEVLL